MKPNVIVTDNYIWNNFHNNISQRILHKYQISNIQATGWRDGLAGIQEMIGEARSRTERVRAYGGKWSLSDVAFCSDSMQDTKPLTFFGTVFSGAITGVPLYADDPKPLNERLYYFQAGCQVNQINSVLESAGLCLPTTGASNGQTIAGAVSTGTHGSALRIGAMQDYVRALHIVTSESEHVMLQSASHPVITSAFSDVFGARLINDDSMFASALVSFGCFGIIHGILVETTSLYTLEVHVQRTEYHRVESLYPALIRFNHAVPNNLGAALGALGLPADADPHHIKFIVNPYATSDNTFLEVMYRRRFDRTALSPAPGGPGRSISNDIISVIGSFTDAVGIAAPVIVNTFFGNAATEQSGYKQTPKNIFTDTVPLKSREGSASAEMGVPIERAAEAVRLVTRVAMHANFVGLVGVRFVKNSSATLAFTRFSPLTCTVELPGLNTSGTKNCYREVFAEMDKARIPFTLHWGQEGDYSPKRLASMYGAAVDVWARDRARLLPDPMQRYMFSNDFLKRCGLAEAPALTGGHVIV